MVFTRNYDDVEYHATMSVIDASKRLKIQYGFASNRFIEVCAKELVKYHQQWYMEY